MLLTVSDSEGSIIERDLPDTLMPRDINGEIKLQPLVECFKKHYNLAASDCDHLVSYFHAGYECFVLCGKFGSLKIPTLQDQNTGDVLRLKIRICLDQVVPSSQKPVTAVKQKSSV